MIEYDVYDVIETMIKTSLVVTLGDVTKQHETTRRRTCEYAKYFARTQLILGKVIGIHRLLTSTTYDGVKLSIVYASAVRKIELCLIPTILLQFLKLVFHLQTEFIDKTE